MISSHLTLRNLLRRFLSDMKIILSSRNQKKIRELRELFANAQLSGVEIGSLDDIGVYGDTEENGTSFEENSLIKACVPAKLGYIGIADDSGLCVDALGGAPGIYSARYSGEHATDAENNAKLLSELDGIPDDRRTARFVCAVSCVFPENFGVETDAFSLSDTSGKYPGITGGLKSFCVRGECEGVILKSPRGENGFGYDPLFYIPDKGRSFSELSSAEKGEISHRGNAMKKFIDIFGRIIRGTLC